MGLLNLDLVIFYLPICIYIYLWNQWEELFGDEGDGIVMLCNNFWNSDVGFSGGNLYFLLSYQVNGWERYYVNWWLCTLENGQIAKETKEASDSWLPKILNFRSC